MSLVDQFLEENQLLDQYTQQSNESNPKEEPQKKQTLNELKKKYNFYNDSDDSSSQEEDQEQEEDKEEMKVQKSEPQVEKVQEAKPYVQRKGKYSFSSSDSEEDEEEEEKETQNNKRPLKNNQYDDSEEDDDENLKKQKKNQTNEEQEEEHDSDFYKAEEDEEEVDNEEESQEKKEQEDEEDDDENEDHDYSNVKEVDDKVKVIVQSYNQREQKQNFKNEINKQSPIQEQHQNDDESELDFYQLSDIDTSNLLLNSVKKTARGGENQESSPEKNILQSSIAKVASMLDSQVQKYDRLLSASQISDRQLSHRQLNDYSDRPQTEMTFGDLSLSDATFYDSKQLQSKLSQQQDSHQQSLIMSQQQQSKRQPQLHQTIIKEEEEEESYSLEYSQASHSFLNSQNLGNLKAKSFNLRNTSANPPENQKNQSLIVKILIDKIHRQKLSFALSKWKEHTLKEFYGVKLKNAAQMVDKMSKFSRSFISLNSLSQILLKNKQRQQARAFIKWTRNTCLYQTSIPQQADPNIVQQLQQKLEQKDQEIFKMEQMFKEYSNWRSKLEMIEQKMKQDVEYWKQACEKLQKDNEKLQKETLKTTQQLMEKTKEIESKQNTIEKLQKKNKQLETVEEAVCQNCKNSLEESTIFTGRGASKRDSEEFQAMQETQRMISELSDKITDLEKEVMIYRERVSYHESVEEELKKNIESQVDVVLKMEEERLILLKENKEMKDRQKLLLFENDEYKHKISIFEKELEDLQEQIKHQMKKDSERQEKTQQSVISTIEDVLSDSETQSIISKTTHTSNKENKSLNKKKSVSTLGAKLKNPKKQTSLKFQTSSGSKVGENSAIFSSQLKSQIQQMQDDKTSKYGAEPVNKSLVTDNQILTNELVLMNREISKLKAELRTTSETLKKCEKERYEQKKNLETKENAVEKLRKERDELWAVVSTDKYKNVKNIETEKEKIEKQKESLEIQLNSLKEQFNQETEATQNSMAQLQLKIQELEFSNQRLKEKEDSREKLLEVLEDKSRKFEKELSLQEQIASTSKKETELLKQENLKLKKDVDWLANSAKNNKLQAERAINDLEAYTKILRGMEKKLAETEIERESKESELRELRQKMMDYPQLILPQQAASKGQMNSYNTQMSGQSMIVGQQMPSQQQQWQQVPNQSLLTQQQQMLLNQSQQQWMVQQQQQQQQQQQLQPRQGGLPQPMQPPQRYQ